MRVPVVVVQKSGHENAQLVADLRRHGFENGVHYKVVDYVEKVRFDDPSLGVVFLGRHWGSTNDREAFSKLLKVRPDIVVTSFDERLRGEGGLCNIRAVPGEGSNPRYGHLARFVESRHRLRERHF